MRILPLLLLAAATPSQARQAAGYTIPTLDLAADRGRQVVVDREPGLYLGHPTTVLLEDGKTILCVYPKGHGRGAIVYKRSVDGGKTWSERLPTPASWATSRETPTIHRIVDRQGKKRLIVWSGLYPARFAISEDEGRTWSELQKAGDWGGIVVMGALTRLHDGSHIALFHDDGRFFAEGGKRREPASMRVYQVRSEDGGLSWSAPRMILESSPHLLCEPGILRSPDGKRLAVLLRENSRTRNSYVIFSADEARTWSQPRELPAALTGDRHTGVTTPDGRLFVTFRDTTRQSPTKGDWVAWVGTWADIVHGRQGQYRVRLMDNHHRWDCAYPGLELLPDGTLVTTTYGHWEAGQKPYLVSLRLSMAELDRLAARHSTVFAHEERHGYRIPALLCAKDGSLLALCERRIGLHDHAENDIVLRRSADGGRSWQELQVIADEGGDSLNDPCAVVLDSGRILLRYTRYPEGVHQRVSKHTVMAEAGYGGAKTTRIYICQSDDHGRTWSSPREVTRRMRRETSISVGGPGVGVQLRQGPHKGRILLANYEGVRIDARRRGFRNSVSISDDGGKTWRLSPAMDDTALAPAQGNEPQLAVCADGSLLFSARLLGSRVPGRKLCWSRDGGETWSAPVLSTELSTPACMSSVVGYRLAEERVLIHSLPHDPKRRANGSLFVSRDGGRHWSKLRSLGPGGFAYSCLAVLPDGDLGCLYETGAGRSFRIMFQRIPHAELEAR